MDEKLTILRHHILGIFKKGHRPWNLVTKLFVFFVIIASLTDVAMVVLFGVLGDSYFYDLWGVNRNNLYGHVLGFFPETFSIIQSWLHYWLEALSRKTEPMELVQFTFQDQ